MEGHLETHDTLDWRQFTIAIKRLADSLSYGADRSPFLGAGVEYVQSRQYQWGDPIRHIDWRVTARTRKPYVKEYEAPKRLPCYLLLDTSASMTVSSQRRSKYAVAVHIAGGLALACLDRVSPVGVVSVGSSGLRIDPSLSRHQVMLWLHRLRKYRYDESTRLGRRIVEMSPTLLNRSLVIVLSDLHDPQAIDALRLLAQMHDCVVLQLRDPAEEHLRGAGAFRAQEAETGQSFVTLGRRAWVDQSKIDEGLRRGGIDHLIISTDKPFAQKLRYFFRSRDLLGKGAR
jgi:uncharacterized protein (DUF58 family)